MTDDAITHDILKFVRQLDGGETPESVLRAAIARHWLDPKGAPTPDGRRLIRSLDDLERFARPQA